MLNPVSLQTEQVQKLLQLSAVYYDTLMYIMMHFYCFIMLNVIHVSLYVLLR